MRICSLMVTFAVIVFNTTINAQSWKIHDKTTITHTTPVSYTDHIEMAGKRVAGIIQYTMDTLGHSTISREVIFPQLRKHIEDNDKSWAVYRAYAKKTWTDDVLPEIYANNRKVNLGAVKTINIDGTLSLQYNPSKQGLAVSRIFYPSVDQRLFVERWTLQNTSKLPLELSLGKVDIAQEKDGPDGKYTIGVKCNPEPSLNLLVGKSYTFDILYYATREGDTEVTSKRTLVERKDLLSKIHDKLVLRTPDETLNTLFAFSKVRAAESIFDSPMGIVHSPGGGRYYTGIWANDQAEYSGPFFPYLGLEDGNVAALNTYKKFWEHMQTIPNHDKNIWASFEMGGNHPCCGTDRGDAAMVAYGGLHYLMAIGDLELCRAYEPMIDWCLTYNHKMKNTAGVIRSESDEMEGRIPTGTANLSTSALYYGALDLAIDYYRGLAAEPAKISELVKRKAALATAIESYFGANTEGLDTYKYFDTHQQLRHWICLPLVVGINERKDDTVDALFDKLWSENGVHVEKNSDNPDISKIFWDRGTLYALRGTIIAGETDISLKKLQEFSKKRLLGDHVPYVVEAYPEGNMAHLSAESALYCRIFIEGLFGIKPVQHNSFDMTPRLPTGWDEMSLDNIMAYGVEHSITVKRKGTDLKVIITAPSTNLYYENTFPEGETIPVTF